MTRFLLIISIWLMAPAAGNAGDFPSRDGQRVAIFGDSITMSGQYVAYLDAFLITRFPDRKVDLINLGLSSETASGLSEKDHPFPRPDVHDRLARGLELTKPDVVLVCYGMNDGIYAPPDPGRLEAYQRGITTVVEASKKAGATVIVGTPPPFDALPIKPRLRPIGADDYGYKNPFDGYDNTLGGYADWLIARRGEGWTVADIHGSTLALLQAMRVEEPGFTLARDGIHPDANGHLLIALAYLKAWKMPAEVDAAVVDASSKMGKSGKVEAIEFERGTLKFTWTTRIPMPTDPRWDTRIVVRERLHETMNRHRLTVTGLDRPRYALFEGETKLGEPTAEQLASGLDLLAFADLSTNRRAAELWPLVVKRRSILDRSWLETVGHGPPNQSRTLPLKQAKQEAEPIEVKIRELARPAPITLRLVPQT